MKSHEKLFLIYFPVPVLFVGILFPAFLDGLRTGDFGSVICLKEGGWMAMAYLASPYILLAGISCFKRKLKVVIPPFIGIVLTQMGYHLEVVSMPIRLPPKAAERRSRHSSDTPGCSHAPSYSPA